MFDPCITHQKLVNKIKGLEAILNPFSMILSSIGPVYYKSYFLHGVFIDFLAEIYLLNTCLHGSHMLCCMLP